MSVLFDNDFSVATSPFGFDVVQNVDGTHGIMEVIDVGSGGVTPWTGSGVRSTTADERGDYTAAVANGAQLRLGDPLINIRDLCPSGYDGAGNIVFASAVLAALDLSLDDARAKGYKSIIRLQFGADAPTGGTLDNRGAATPNWMALNTTASKFKPVPYVETIANDSSGRVAHVPIFWNDERIHITGNPGGGTWTITFNGQTTTALAFDIGATGIQAALEALSNVTPGQVFCAGSLETNGGTGVTIDYHQGLSASTATMTVDGGGLTGGTAPSATITHSPANANMEFHYDAILTAFAAYLEGTTAAGTRRKDYVMFIPVSMPTEIGTEMSLGFGSNSAYFDPVQNVNGVRIGNVNPSTGQVMVGTRSNGVNGVLNESTVNKPSWYGHITHAFFNANTTDKPRSSWLCDWYHNPASTTSPNGTAAHAGAWMDAIAIHMSRFPNTASAVAWGGILSDAYVRAQDIIRQPSTIQTYGFTRLWSMQTNLRIYPPNGQNPATSTTPKSQWSYRNWSTTASDTMLLVLAVAAPRTPLQGFQTAGSTATGNSYGMPPPDFVYASRDAYNTYKAQFLEASYLGVFTSAANGAQNSSFVNNELNAALAANGALVSQGGVVGKGLHVQNDGVNATGPLGKETAAVSGKPDIYYRFVVAEIGSFAGVASLLFSQDAAGSNNGDVSLRLNTTGHLLVRWNASSAPDWTDTTALAVGDVVEMHVHYDQAAPTTASGYEVKVNDTVRHTNMGLSSGTGGLPTTVSFVQLGLPTNVAAEFIFQHFGADDAQYMGAPQTVVVNTGPPDVTVTQPFDGQQFTTTDVLVVATGADPDSIAIARLNVDGGPWLRMAEQGTDATNDTWELTVALAGTPGTDVQHTITVQMIDGFSSPLAGQDQATITISLPAQGGGGDTMPFAKTIYLGVEDYAAIHDRFYGMGHYVEGVAPRLGTFVGGTSTDARTAVQVKQRAAGANMSVDINAGWAFVQGDDVVNQALYADYNNGIVNLAYATVGPPSTNPRIDMVVARINDSEHTNRTPADQMYFEIVPGTPLTGTLGASLANPLGRAALPPSALWLADIEVHTDSGTAGITTAQIGDRRKLYGPALYSENGKRYRLGVDAFANLGLEELA